MRMYKTIWFSDKIFPSYYVEDFIMETNESMTKRELWRVRIDQYRSSGMTAKDWCISKDLSVSSLRYWITKFNKSEQFPEQEA